MSPVRSLDERKLVTVLFADLASSTELATRHDPEQVRALLSAFFEEMAQQILALGGTVEKYAGDAIMAVFGVPRVHEDDAERSVRAAVAMRESLAQLNPMFEQDYGVQLELRVGIASGEAVAAAGPAREFLVTGEVANLAARLQSASGGIVISEETHRLVGPFLEAERLEPLTLKGFAETVTAYRVDGLRPLEAGARGIPGLSSPVVGREAETESLRRSIEELASGRGQVVSITGEAGLGKSRLKIERRESLPEGLRWIEGRCHAYTQSTSYAPLIQILRAVFQLTGGEAQAIARTKVRAAIRSLAGERHDQAQAAVAHLLGIELEPGRRGEGAADPQQLQAQIVVGLRALLEGLLARSPTVLAVEDIHWADTASIDTLTVLTELTDFLPLMILVTSRPDVEGGSWSFRFHAQRNFPHRLTEIQLKPLAPEASERLANNLLHVSELPEPLRRQMMERSEGNPFFLEEIIRTLIERQVLRREGDRWIAVADGGGTPDQLRAHQIGQCAVEIGIVLGQRQQSPSGEEAPDEARRREGLRQIEAAMRTATEIGDVGLLVRLEAREGNISSDESVLRRMLARAEASGDRMTLALAHSQYGDFLGNQGRYEEALTRYGRAIDLLGAEGARYDQAMNMTVGGRCYSSRAGRIDDALSYAARAREIGEELGDARLRAWRAMEAEPYLYRGLWAEVVQVAEENLPLAFEIGEWGVMLFTSAWLGMAYVKLGRLDEAGRVLERAAREDRARVGYSYPMSFVQTAVAQLHLALGEPARAVEAAREALELAERGGFRLEQGAAHRILGLALEALGSRKEADSAFRKSREILEAIQSSPEVAQTLLGHGRFLARDDRAAGRALVERALVMFEEMGATGWLEEARRAL